MLTSSLKRLSLIKFYHLLHSAATRLTNSPGCCKFRHMGRYVRIAIIVLVLVAAFALLGWAGWADRAAWADEVERDQWLRSFPFEVVGYFCRQEMFFMQCFEVSVHECTQVASTAVDVCLDYISEQLPESLDSGARELWGARLISCAGSVYEQALKQRLVFRDNARCGDPSNWQGGSDMEQDKQR